MGGTPSNDDSGNPGCFHIAALTSYGSKLALVSFSRHTEEEGGGAYGGEFNVPQIPLDMLPQPDLSH